jgi:hypothetical protein
MKKRIKLLYPTGRVPCINLDTGVQEDFIMLEGSEIVIDTETGASETLPDNLSEEEIRKDVRKYDLLTDPLEKVLYEYRWEKVFKKEAPECGTQ